MGWLVSKLAFEWEKVDREEGRGRGVIRSLCYYDVASPLFLVVISSCLGWLYVLFCFWLRRWMMQEGIFLRCYDMKDGFTQHSEGSWGKDLGRKEPLTESVAVRVMDELSRWRDGRGKEGKRGVAVLWCGAYIDRTIHCFLFLSLLR